MILKKVHKKRGFPRMRVYKIFKDGGFIETNTFGDNLEEVIKE